MASLATNGLKNVEYDWECCEHISYAVPPPKECIKFKTLELIY